MKLYNYIIIFSFVFAETACQGRQIDGVDTNASEKNLGSDDRGRPDEDLQNSLRAKIAELGNAKDADDLIKKAANEQFFDEIQKTDNWVKDVLKNKDLNNRQKVMFTWRKYTGGLQKNVFDTIKRVCAGGAAKFVALLMSISVVGKSAISTDATNFVDQNVYFPAKAALGGAMKLIWMWTFGGWTAGRSVDEIKTYAADIRAPQKQEDESNLKIEPDDAVGSLEGKPDLWGINQKIVDLVQASAISDSKRPADISAEVAGLIARIFDPQKAREMIEFISGGDSKKLAVALMDLRGNLQQLACLPYDKNSGKANSEYLAKIGKLINAAVSNEVSCRAAKNTSELCRPYVWGQTYMHHLEVIRLYAWLDAESEKGMAMTPCDPKETEKAQKDESFGSWDAAWTRAIYR